MKSAMTPSGIDPASMNTTVSGSATTCTAIVNAIILRGPKRSTARADSIMPVRLPAARQSP